MVVHVSPDSLDWITGVRVYLTDGQGIGGIIKAEPEDFIVEELSESDTGEEGNYLILDLEKRDWEMHNLVRVISRILGISRRRINWAGTKDKRAVTKQRISIWKIDASEIERIRLNGVKLNVVGRSQKKIAIGDLYANQFEIIVREVNSTGKEVENSLIQIQSEIKAHGGVINYFGNQRFGVQRPINHRIGELLIKGEFEDAAYLLLTATFGREDEEVEEVRRFIYTTGDFKRAVELMPKGLHLERTILHALINKPDDYLGAFLTLPKQLYKIFIHAYQSYIFNRIVSARMEEGLGLNEAEEGDIVCFRNKHGFADVRHWQVVRSHEVAGINDLIARGRAFVTAPLIGFETEIAGGREGEIEHKILESCKIEPEDFRMDEVEALASGGMRREIKLPVDPSFEVLGDRMVKFAFVLPKGGYATIVLREFMKTCDTPGKGFEPLRG
ncbi:MAG: tRNA pseudouridine synthase D [Candidatus Syntrophoarchaeum caldarius]|uniref:Probable tRNA pseudouridine synthase D n=1 Tax=Candidatus Syntropharchaeum caldarium TaxID=1838285 RepID=A0A1F2PBW5_9EURY|nr:MAG: tRNA pseudouridine synthase D [Candidatus Syntrophoarchaeum caldarius]